MALSDDKVESICIVIGVVSIGLFVTLLLAKLVENDNISDKNRRITKVEAIKACAKTKNPPLCLSALDL